MTGNREEWSNADAGQLESPWVDGAHPTVAQRTRARAARAVLDHFTLLLLLATAGIVVVSALPTMERILSGDPAATARRGIARTMWAKGYAVGPPEVTHPHPALGDAALSIGARSRRPQLAFGEPNFEELERFEKLLNPGPGATDDDTMVGSGAIAPRDLVLLDEASLDSDPAVTIRRGQVLVVVRDEGDWLLLAFKDGEHLELGWARQDQVLLFP